MLAYQAIMRCMKIEVTRTSWRYSGEPEELTLNTLEELRDFILAAGHPVIVSVPKYVVEDEKGNDIGTNIPCDELDIEIYDEQRE